MNPLLSLLRVAFPLTVLGGLAGTALAAPVCDTAAVDPARVTFVESLRPGDDDDAFRRALGRLPSTGGIIVVPTRSDGQPWRLTRPLVIDRDDVCVRGAPGSAILHDPPTDELMTNESGRVVSRYFDRYSVFTVSRSQVAPYPDNFVPIARIGFSGLEIRGAEALLGPDSNSVIQLNHCVDCLVENVTIRWRPLDVPVSIRGRNLDGITLASGSSGVVRDVTIEAIPKTALYLNGYAHDILAERVVVVDQGLGAGGGWGAGIGLAGTNRVTIRDCSVRNGASFGLLIKDTKPAATAIATTSTTVDGCVIERNGSHGVAIAASEGAMPVDTRLHRLTVNDNAGIGINVTSGRDVQIVDTEVHRNGDHGISLQNGRLRSDNVTAGIEVTRVRSTANGNGSNRYHAALAITGVDDVSVSQAQLRGGGATEVRPRLLFMYGGGQPSTDVNVVDVDVANLLVIPVPGAVRSGSYDLIGRGHPMQYGEFRAVLEAPGSSTYFDAASATHFVRCGASWLAGELIGGTVIWPC